MSFECTVGVRAERALLFVWLACSHAHKVSCCLFSRCFAVLSTQPVEGCSTLQYTVDVRT